MTSLTEIKAEIAAQERPELFSELSRHIDQLEAIQASIDAKAAKAAKVAPPVAAPPPDSAL